MICPNCGNEADELDELTGWCKSCSPNRCDNCGKQCRRNLCNSCQRIKWLEEHADEIEELQSKGMSLSAARQAIYDNNRPTCLVCNEPILHASNGASFCNRNIKCRSARRRYRTLRTGKHKLPDQIALEQVLRELGIEQ